MPNDSAGAFELPLAGALILVVDDNFDILELFTLMLTLSGAEVVAVKSAAEVMGALDRAHFHALVSDVHMPGESGLELIRRVRVRSDAVALPAVAVTADVDPNLHAELLKAGFQRYLSRPVDASDLTGTLRELVTAA